MSSDSRTWWKVVRVLILAPVGWCALLYVTGGPIDGSTSYVCWTCRAGKRVDRLFMIPTKTTMRQNDFSTYYLRHSDPQHRHIWCWSGGHDRSRKGERYADGGPRPWLVHDAALAVLRSLPKGQAQKAFFEQLYPDDKTIPEQQRLAEAIMELNQAHWQDKHRTDWPEQLRRVGLYPKVRGKKP